jgi:ABC-type multidrug transport system ATPase subunit
MDEAERCTHVGYIQMSKLVVCGVPEELKHLPAVNPPGTKRWDVTCEHVTAAMQALRHMPGVQNATVFGQSMHLLVDEQMSEGTVRAQLAALGIKDVDIRPIGPSLEDVFVALTANRNGEQKKEGNS